MARIPDIAEHRRRFLALSMRDRREIMWAVTRGETLEDRNKAALAVGVARQQAKVWRWAWPLGPLAALFQLDQGWVAVLGYAVIGTAVTGGFSLLRIRRCRRAELGNLARATGKR